jgi:hypothetical protein
VANRQGGTDRRLTKAERKDQARLEREQIQRKMQRRRRQQGLGAGLLIGAAVIVVLVVFLLPKNDTPAGPIPTPDALLARAPEAKTAAGCGDVQTVPFYGGITDRNAPGYQDQAHFGASEAFPEAPLLASYPSTPPTSGPHDPTPLQAGIYDRAPDIMKAIHSLEHGAAIVWYSPDAPQAVIDEIKNFYAQSVGDVSAGQDRVIVAPYDYPDEGAAALIPDGKQMAVVAWHHLQTCASPDLAVALDFTSQYAAPPVGSPAILGRQYLGEAPEAGGQM